MSRRLALALVLFTTLGLASPAQAGKDKATAAYWADHPKAAKKVQVHPNLKPIQKKVGKTVGKPKKVGLISYMAWDGAGLEAMYVLNQDGVNILADGMAKATVDGMKAEFDEHGMQLLTPDEFLDSEADTAAYEGFELDLSGLAKAMASIVNGVRNDKDITGAAEGYQMIPAHLVASDHKAKASLSALREQLELDAVAVFVVTSFTSPKEAATGPMHFYMWGENPVPQPSNKLAAKLWAPDEVYCSGTWGQGGLVFMRKKKGETTVNLDGYDAIVRVLLDEVLTDFTGNL